MRQGARTCARRRGRRQTCQAWPSSMTLTSSARCRSSSRPRSRRCAWNRRYQAISTSSGVADAVRARQQRDVAEFLEPLLVRDAARKAGDPQGRSARPERCWANSSASWLSQATACGLVLSQPQPGGARRPARQRAPLGRPGGLGHRRVSLMPVPELELAVSLSSSRSISSARLEHVRVGLRSPGHRPHHTASIWASIEILTSAAMLLARARARPILPHLEEQLADRSRPGPSGARRQHGDELSLIEPALQNVLGGLRVRGAVVSEFGDEIADRRPVRTYLRLARRVSSDRRSVRCRAPVGQPHCHDAPQDRQWIASFIAHRV